jgi:hypothetical protein
VPRGLDPEIVRSAEDAARKPDFAEVLARGRALSRRRTATAVAAAVLVCAGLVGATQLPGRQEAAPVAPTPTPTPTSSESASGSADPDRPTAQQIVDDPASRLVEVRVVPGEPDVRAALWSRCASPACDVRQQAVVLTDDGFATRTVADAPLSDASIRVSGNGDVVVLDYRATLKLHVIRTDGTQVAATMSTEAVPVAEGEVVGGVDYAGSRPIFWATDTTTAQAHAVPVPDDTRQLIQTDSGQLRAMTARSSHAWSDDGGETWTERGGAVDSTLLSSIVTSTDDTHVVVGGGDGATLAPFNQIRRLAGDGTWSVIDVPGNPTAYVGPQAVLPDGRFLVAVEDWSDRGRPDQPLEGTPPGIYVSDGDDWSAYSHVESGAPFETPEPMQPMVTDIEVSDAGTLITALGPDQTTAWTSTDLGVTWHEMRAR